MSAEPSSSIDIWRRRCFIAVTLVAWLALVAGLVWFLKLVIGPLILLTLAGLVAYVVYPLVKLVQKVMPRKLAILIVFMFMLLLLVFLLYFIVIAAIEQLASLIAWLQTFVQNPALQKQLQPFLNFLTQIGSSPQQLVSALKQVAGYLQSAVVNVLPLIGNVFAVLINGIILASLCVYFLMDGSRFIAWIRHRTPRRFRVKANFFLDTLEHSLGGFVRGQIILASIITLITVIGALIIGVPFVVLLGVIAFVFEFVPIIGAYISGTIAILFALTQGWQTALIMGIFVTIVNGVLEGQILAPRILGQSIGLHPIISIAALLIGSQLFGVLGALLAAPIAGLIQRLVQAAWVAWRSNHLEEFVDVSREDASGELASFSATPGRTLNKGAPGE
ncbi:AI-2E family transporter [Ktedonospora formicarum]|nr:AI-2E family transporter [Ktedonospora formicarum]